MVADLLSELRVCIAREYFYVTGYAHLFGVHALACSGQKRFTKINISKLKLELQTKTAA
jgi:hypothetical protein